MKRREFIHKSALSSALVVLPSLPLMSFSTHNTKHITLLHTNDTHSHIDPFEASHPKNPNQGGIARRATLVDQIRKENPNTLLLDAGDIFQGTPYFNYYGGELELKLMSMMKYDAATLGNHEFDNGLEGILAPLPHATFDFISSNYDFSNTLLDGFIKNHKVFVVDGVRIGIFGLGVELDGLVSKVNYKETHYLDPIEIAQDMARLLKHEKKCDLVICLSHIGYKYDSDKVSDLVLAAKTKDIDLIIGGHTHTFLSKPTLVKNIEGNEVLVNQVGCYGINLGRIDFYLQPDKIATNGRSIKVG
ncbi:MAG TPA: metallophosphoesterase [Flavobacterium sp.]|nr:metallophosphoesterase [Flavobacterium sp.]